MNTMEKLKVYLDTNTILDFFINQAVALKRNEEPKIPKKLEFFLESIDKAEFITSVATKAEIARELVSGHALSEEQFERLWRGFLDKLKCSYIEKVSLDARFGQIPVLIEMKLRTLVNFIHLFIAMNENAYLVTGDKDLIRVCRNKKIYDKVESYVELRELISSLS